MKYLILLSVLFFSSSSKFVEQTLAYDVIMKEKTVGELKVTKTQRGELTFYKSFTKIKAHILRDIHVHYQFDVTFHKKMLTQAKAIIKVNDKTHEETTTRWNGKEYDVKFFKRKKKTVANLINYSSVMLMTEEPHQMDQSYSEQDGRFHALEHIGNHTYQKTTPKGRVNKYFYKDGELVRGEINAGLVKFQIVKKD